jgi:hypothetical protein
MREIKYEVYCTHCGKSLYRSNKCKHPICFECKRKEINLKANLYYKNKNKKYETTTKNSAS